ncbi:MAG: PEP-CTERM sorting domain-containing protein [Deltaproteobacteria bacterium]|nr:MAG: PEP-CTERM sorting domain-containing protein [Deltaproteobacteria bacterium]
MEKQIKRVTGIVLFVLFLPLGEGVAHALSFETAAVISRWGTIDFQSGDGDPLDYVYRIDFSTDAGDLMRQVKLSLDPQGVGLSGPSILHNTFLGARIIAGTNDVSFYLSDDHRRISNIPIPRFLNDNQMPTGKTPEAINSFEATHAFSLLVVLDNALSVSEMAMMGFWVGDLSGEASSWEHSDGFTQPVPEPTTLLLLGSGGLLLLGGRCARRRSTPS